ncbi:MAG: reductase [Pseudonocardiales bacterium]|nr:reductase [Pseudonocardiales bacterium]
MRIAVLGGTGMIGSQLVAEAAARGHQVTSVSRSGNDPKLDGVSAEAADASTPATIETVIAGHDVIVSALGPSREPGADHQPFLDIIATLIATMREATSNGPGIRLIVVGGAGSLVGSDGTRLVDRPDFPPAYKPESLTQAEALQLLLDRGGDINWTYLSPAPEIAPGERTGNYAVGGDSPVGSTISVEDFAVALVDEIESPSHARERFTVAN